MELSRIRKLTERQSFQITHHFDDVFALADRIAIMQEKDELFRLAKLPKYFCHPSDTFVAEFLGIGNLIKGVARRAGSLAEIVAVGGVTIVAASGAEGDVIATLHAEDVIVSKAPFASSARNCLPGTVTDLLPSGSTIKVFIDVGFPLVALLTRESCRELEIAPDSRVYATFKASAVHVIPVNGT